MLNVNLLGGVSFYAMKDIQDKFFHLLRLGIGATDSIPHINGDEWREIYEIANKQSLLGVVFDGVQKMSDAVKEKGESVEMGVDLLLTWMGKCKQIEKRNVQLNAAVGKVSGWFQKKGFRSCILKGQGNALMYPNPVHRTPGDIDIWVSGKPSEVIRFVHNVAPHEKASYHHIDFPAINGIPVEVHYRPCYLQNPLHNHRLQRWFRQCADEQFSHVVPIDGGKVAVPTASFNAVYQLVHIYNHLFQEGIGLRQIVDYYFVVSMLSVNCEMLNCKQDNSQISQHLTLNIQHSLKHLGLWKFAGAVMHVLHEVLGLSEEKMIAPIDEKRGKLLLNEILQGGNFGQYDTRYRFCKGALGHNLQRLFRDFRMVRYYPAEALCEPIFRIWHFLWRLVYSLKHLA